VQSNVSSKVAQASRPARQEIRIPSIEWKYTPGGDGKAWVVRDRS
jgi:hypothetical protein